MSSRCSSSTCLNGNCQGCKNGSKYCNDPRCYPNCPDCSGETSINCIKKRSGWDWTLLIIITGLAIILLIILAWGLYNNSSSNDNNEMNQDVYNQTYYQQGYYPTEYYQNNPEYQNYEDYAPPSTVPQPYDREIDASLNFDVGMDNTPMSEVLSEIPPTTRGIPSVASSQIPPPAPIRPTPMVDTTIRGF